MKTVRKTVKKSEFKGQWPFNVDEVQLIKRGYQLIVKVNSKKYALNGLAYKYLDIDPIWLAKTDSLDSSGKVSLNDIIEFANNL